MDRRYVTPLHSFYPSVFWWGSWSQWEEMPIELQYLEDAQHCPRVVLEGYERNKTWCRSRKTQTQHIHSNVVFPAWETRLIQAVRDRKSVEVTEIPTAWLKMGGAHLFLPFPWPHSQPCLHSIPKWRSRGSRNRRDANKLTVSWMDGVKPRSWRVRSKSVLSCKLSADKSIFVGIERVAKTHVEGLRLCPQPRVLQKSKSRKRWLWDRAPCCGTWRQRHILASWVKADRIKPQQPLIELPSKTTPWTRRRCVLENIYAQRTWCFRTTFSARSIPKETWIQEWLCAFQYTTHLDFMLTTGITPSHRGYFLAYISTQHILSPVRMVTMQKLSPTHFLVPNTLTHIVAGSPIAQHCNGPQQLLGYTMGNLKGQMPS